MCRYRFHVKIEKFIELEKKLETAESSVRKIIER